MLCDVPPKNKLKPGYSHRLSNKHTIINLFLHVCLCSHSFGATENYFVLLEQPLRFNLPKVMKNTLLNKPTIPDKMFEWQENELVCMSDL